MKATESRTRTTVIKRSDESEGRDVCSPKNHLMNAYINRSTASCILGAEATRVVIGKWSGSRHFSLS